MSTNQKQSKDKTTSPMQKKEVFQKTIQRMKRRSELLSVMNKTINKYMSLYRTVEKDERTFHVKQRQRIQNL